jgi:hypothetical protein
MERWQSLAECAALEMQYTLACIGGSNPSLSALVNDDKALQKQGFSFSLYSHQSTGMNQYIPFLLQKRDTIWDTD